MTDSTVDQLGLTSEQLEALYEHPSFHDTIALLEKKNPRFKTLSPEVKRAAMAMFLQGDLNKVSSMWKLFYKRPVPTISEFLTPEFIGANAAWYTDRSPWSADLKKALGPSSNILEWAIGGAVGIAKSSVSCVAHLYNLYRVTSLREPSLAMGEGKSNPLAIMLLTVTKDKAGDLFKVMLLTIKECQYFIEVKSQDDFKEYTKHEFCQYVPYLVHKVDGFDRITFPGNVFLRSGSQKSHTIGLNLFGATLDEAEFRGGAKKADEAMDLYTEVLNRVTSRFVGSQYKLICMISSVKHDTGVMAKHIKSLQEEEHLGRSLVSSYSQWQIKKEYFGAEEQHGYFYVMAGTVSNPSKMLSDEECGFHEQGLFQIPDQCRVVKVPKHPALLSAFLRNPDRALRDQAGIVTAGGERPFDNLASLDDELLLRELTLIAQVGQKESLFEQLPQEELFQRTPGGLKLRRFPDAPRFCFTGDTLVATASGRDKTMEELTQDHDNGVQNWTYTWSPEGWVLGRVESAHVSKWASELVEITISNGEKVHCTPDHKFMLSTGEYKEAQTLLEGEELKSLGVQKYSVGAIQGLSLEEPIPVYDLTIQESTDSHNFALGAGVIVANCHLDLADTGEAGIGICHKEVTLEGVEMYIVDFVAKVISPTRISQTLIEELLVDLKEVGNMKLEVLSADQYQSTYMRERLESLHKVAKSVRKVAIGGKTSIEPFQTCADLIADGVVRAGHCPELKEQLRSVYIHNNQIQYDGERKDMVDCFIGALYVALNSPLVRATNIYDTYEKVNKADKLKNLPGMRKL